MNQLVIAQTRDASATCPYFSWIATRVAKELECGTISKIIEIDDDVRPMLARLERDGVSSEIETSSLTTNELLSRPHTWGATTLVIADINCVAPHQRAELLAALENSNARCLLFTPLRRHPYALLGILGIAKAFGEAWITGRLSSNGLRWHDGWRGAWKLLKVDITKVRNLWTRSEWQRYLHKTSWSWQIEARLFSEVLVLQPTEPKAR